MMHALILDAAIKGTALLLLVLNHQHAHDL